jgi:hypothetical protein
MDYNLRKGENAMPTRSKTLRSLPPNTRKYYRLCDELQSICNRIKSMRAIINSMEFEARALYESELHKRKGVSDVRD